MDYPDYLSYFYRKGQKLFEVLSDLDDSVAEAILEQDVLWRGDGTYLTYRKEHERYLRERFIEKGGKPKREHPVYMILGDSPTGPHDLAKEYACKLIVPLSVFSPLDISFTYPDSLYKVPLDDLGRPYLEREPAPSVHRMDELEELIQTYKVYEFNNHYVEAQIWNNEPLMVNREL